MADLKKILMSLSSSDEQDKILALDVQKNIGKATEEQLQKIQDSLELLAKATSSSKESQNKVVGAMTSGFDTFITKLASKLDDLTKTIAKENNKIPTVNFSDSFMEQLVSINKHSKNTSELITNLKWNTNVALRNSSGSPIDPATDGIGVGSYDYVALSNYSGNNAQTITFKKNGSSGSTVATLTLTYDGSGNILTVTKI